MEPDTAVDIPQSGKLDGISSKDVVAQPPLQEPVTAPAAEASQKAEAILDVSPITAGIVGRVFRLSRFEFFLIFLGSYEI